MTFFEGRQEHTPGAQHTQNSLRFLGIRMSEMGNIQNTKDPHEQDWKTLIKSDTGLPSLISDYPYHSLGVNRPFYISTCQSRKTHRWTS